MSRQIIDVHVHAFGGLDIGAWLASQEPVGAAQFTNPLTGETLRAVVGAKEHVEATLAAFDDVGVVRALVSPVPTASAAGFKEASPDRVLVGRKVTDSDVAEARAAHAAGEFDVISEIAVQYAGISPDDPQLEPLYALAEELDVPVGYHLMAGGPPGRGVIAGMGAMRAAHGNPLLFEDVLQRHPRMRIFIMHAAWPLISELLALLYAYPQVFVDISAINWCLPQPEFHGYLRRIVEAGFTDRVMFGSDQMAWPSTIVRAAQTVEDAKFLSEGQKQAIFHDNAAGFLRL
ncbi:MAG: amidohydrolase family protein [Actinobacteria bacterium]|nr:amidohydrolase family protein [Actinomycetota bacterium]